MRVHKETRKLPHRENKMKITAMIHQDATNVQPNFEQAINSALADLTQQQRLFEAQTFVLAKCGRFRLWPANTEQVWEQIKPAVALYDGTGQFTDYVAELATPVVEIISTQQNVFAEEKLKTWRRKYAETIRIPIVGVLHRSGIPFDDQDVAEVTTSFWDIMISKWSKHGEARSLISGKVLTDIDIFTIPECDCQELPTGEWCMCHKGKKLRKAQTLAGWLFRLAEKSGSIMAHAQAPQP